MRAKGYESHRVEDSSSSLLLYNLTWKCVPHSRGGIYHSMLVFDALIYNEDRHFGNFGVLRDNHSGQILAPAPIFDNGLSLFCYAGKEDYADLEAYAKTRANPYGVSYESICTEVMGAKQKEQLRRMIGFRFRRHPSLNLPEEHLTAIEGQIQTRVRQLLAIPSRAKIKPDKEKPER